MSTMHTPGPWLREGQTVYALMHAGWRKGVEQLKNRFSTYVQADRECPDEEHEANILLIAAAPEILEALQEAENALADYIPTVERTGASLNYGHSVLKKASAAIAKATGEPA